MTERHCQCPGCYRKQGCWYKKAEWRRTAPAVLRRDRNVCHIVEGCQRRATVADHIIEVHPFTAWHEFIAMSGLRAGCHFHNTRRGMAARYARETSEAPVGPSHVFARRSRFSRPRVI